MVANVRIFLQRFGLSLMRNCARVCVRNAWFELKLVCECELDANSAVRVLLRGSSWRRKRKKLERREGGREEGGRPVERREFIVFGWGAADWRGRKNKKENARTVSG